MAKKKRKKEVTFTPLGGGFYRCNLCPAAGKSGKMKKTKLDGHRSNCPNLLRRKK